MRTLVLVLILSCASWATFTPVQHVSNTACGSSNTCALTVASTGSGHLLVVALNIQNPSRTISSISAGCASWAHGANTAGTNASYSTDIYYCLNSTAGVTSMTVTLAGGIGTMYLDCVEYSFSGASIAYDTSNNINNTTNTLRGGVDLTALTGTNDLLYQVIKVSGAVAVSAINGAYSSGYTLFGTGYGCATAVNSTTGTAPTWTFASNSQSVGSGLAIKEVSAAGMVKRRHGGVF